MVRGALSIGAFVAHDEHQRTDAARRIRIRQPIDGVVELSDGEVEGAAEGAVEEVEQLRSGDQMHETHDDRIVVLVVSDYLDAVLREKWNAGSFLADVRLAVVVCGALFARHAPGGAGALTARTTVGQAADLLTRTLRPDEPRVFCSELVAVGLRVALAGVVVQDETARGGGCSQEHGVQNAHTHRLASCGMSESISCDLGKLR